MRRALLALALVTLVVAAAPAGIVGSAAAQSTVVFEKATMGDEQTKTVSFTFTYDGSSDDRLDVYRGRNRSGNVEFDFSEWENLDTGKSGSSSPIPASPGNQIRVTYEVTVDRDEVDADSNTYITVEISGQSSGFSYSEQLTADVRAPEFRTINRQDGEAVFKGGSEATAEVEVTVHNDGDGVMVTDSVSFSGEPTGFDVSANGLADQIRGGGSDTMTIEATVDESVDPGQESFTATVEDNLGNTTSFDVTVDVVKPPVVSVDDISVGDVLVGHSATTEFTISEAGGYEGISGVSASASGGQYGDVRFGGVRYVSTSPGGSDTAEVTVSVDDNAPQHSTQQWRVEFTPDDPQGVSDTATVSARVVYPAEFGAFEFGTTEFTFDEPQSQVSQQTQTIAVSVPNEGDLDMDVRSASASADGPLSAEVVSAPSTIPGQGEGEVRVQVSAPSSATESSYEVTVSVDGSDRTGAPGRKSASEQVEIVHTNELRVADATLGYGEVRLTQRVTQSTDVSEHLEYEDVNDLTVEQVSGPDRWLTVEERPPSTLDAGEDAPFVVALEFDTDAELFREYTWEFEVSGDGVETQTITVSARAKPVNFDAIRSPLADRAGGSGWQADTASGMATVFDRLESKLSNGESVPEGDLPSAVAAGKATLLYIDSAEAAQSKIDAGNNSAAQRDVVRAVAAHNIMSFYVDRIDAGDLQGPASTAVDAAGSHTDAMVAAQTDYLTSRLSADDTTVLERAQLNRQRARLALLQGDREQAAAYRQQSQAAFDEYIGLVEDASAERQNATRLREEMREDTMTVVLGQPLMLNPAKWDAFDRQSAAVVDGYDASAETFAEAGAVEEAAASRELQSEAAGEMQLARYSLYGSTVVYLLGFLGLLGHVGRSTYAYVRDAEEAVAGDFLVAG